MVRYIQCTCDNNQFFDIYQKIGNMFGKSLMQSSQNLTALSLESFIIDATSQGINYPFYELLTHPKIHTINPKVHQILKLFSQNDFTHYKENKQLYQQINQRQVITLKKLTILSEFEGQNTRNMHNLQLKIDSSQNELIDLLLQLNIEGSIAIKIDQKQNKIFILNAQRRNFPITQTKVSAAQANLQRITMALQNLYSSISEVKNICQIDSKHNKTFDQKYED